MAETQVAADRPTGKGLMTSAIGLLSSTVIGLAATAPAYSITATLGFVVIAVGLHAPALMLLAFFPMAAIAVGYAQLNMAVSTAAQAYGGVGTKGLGLANLATAPDVLANLGQSVLGGTLNKLLILATLSSAIGALQTGILPTARTTLAMATYRALPASFARIDRKYATPSVSTLAIGGGTAVLFAVLTYVSHGKVQADSILSIGLLIAFYYGMVGYTCAWQFRGELRSGGRALLVKGIVPLFGAAVLTYAFVESAIQMWKPSYGYTSFHGIGGVFLLGFGTIVLGAVIMLAYRLAQPSFFLAGRALPDAPAELAGS